jgi:hypothetical protein
MPAIDRPTMRMCRHGVTKRPHYLRGFGLSAGVLRTYSPSGSRSAYPPSSDGLLPTPRTPREERPHGCAGCPDLLLSRTRWNFPTPTSALTPTPTPSRVDAELLCSPRYRTATTTCRSRPCLLASPLAGGAKSTRPPGEAPGASPRPTLPRLPRRSRHHTPRTDPSRSLLVVASPGVLGSQTAMEDACAK